MKTSFRQWLLLVAVLSMSSPLFAQHRCGISVKNSLRYLAPHSDGRDADPTVVKISENPGRETVWVQYFFSLSDAVRIVRTDDSGHSWRPDPTFHETSVIHSENLSVVYKKKQDHLLQKSLDGGIHWTDCKFNVNGLSAHRFADASLHDRRGTLIFSLSAIDPRNPATLYGTFSVEVKASGEMNLKSASLPGVYVSRDAGDNWAMFAPGLRGDEANELTQLGISTSNPQIMVGHATSGVVITRDGGKTWLPVGQQTDLERPTDLAGRKEALERAAKRGLVAAYGLYPPMTHLKVQQIAFQPGDSKVIYLLTNKGLYKTVDSGRGWNLVYVSKPYAGKPPLLYGIKSLFLDPSDANRLYLGTLDKVFVSDDGGCHFRTFFDWHSFNGNHGARPVERGRANLAP
jgi:hypothetical protein